jgi:hypothetical protein
MGAMENPEQPVHDTAVPATTSSPDVWERIKQHKVVQWTLAYLALAYTLLHGAELLGSSLGWSHGLLRVFTLLLIMGVPVAIIVSWYHGARGQRRVSGTELMIIAILLAMGGTYLWRDSKVALRLDPNLSLAYAVRAEVQGYDYQRCLEIDPACEVGRRHLAIVQLYLGRTDEALRLLEMGLENGYVFNDAQLTPAVAARGDRVGTLSILTVEYKDDPQLIRPPFRALTDPTFSDRDRQEAVKLVQDAKNSAEWVAMGDYWRKHGFPPQCKPIGDSDFECP